MSTLVPTKEQDSAVNRGEIKRESEIWGIGESLKPLLCLCDDLILSIYLEDAILEDDGENVEVDCGDSWYLKYSCKSHPVTSAVA